MRTKEVQQFSRPLAPAKTFLHNPKMCFSRYEAPIQAIIAKSKTWYEKQNSVH